jgi:hypothetical protein
VGGVDPGRTATGNAVREAAARASVTGESEFNRGDGVPPVMTETETESSGASVAPADVAPELYEEDGE